MSEEIKKVTETSVAPEATDKKETATTAAPATPAAAAEPVETVSAADSELRSMLGMYGDADAILPKLHELGVESVDDLSTLEESDLTGAGMKLVQARKLISNLKNVEVKKAAAEAAAKSPTAMFAADWRMVLPSPSTDDSFLKALRTGGVLKVGDPTYEAALRVMLADRCNIYRVPELLSSAIETFADESEEPVPESFWKIRKNIARRDYSEIFAGIDGLDGTFATKSRRNEFLRRMRDELCPAIREAYVALDGWYKSEVALCNNTGTLMQAWASMMSGSGVGMGMTHAPTDTVLDASNTLKDKINRVFRGTSAPVAAAMANDAMEIVKILNDPTLPPMVGVPNREMMLKKLGISISPNYARLEQNLVCFVLSFVKFEEAAGNEQVYLNALYQLGTMINWEELGISTASNGVSSIGGHRPL